jgi:hypothetical protein
MPHPLYCFSYVTMYNFLIDTTDLSNLYSVIKLTIILLLIKNTVTYSGFSIHDGTLLHSKSQYTTVKHSRKLFEHTYTSDLYGLGTLTPIEFFQQDLLWQSSQHSLPFLQSESFQTHVRTIHRRAIDPLAHHNGTSSYTSLTCTSPDDRMSSSSTVLTHVLLSQFPIRT